MTAQAPPLPILVFGYGNPSRGDDALGPELIRLLELELKGTPLQQRVDLLTDYQLQIEHLLDLEGREQVIFVDADVTLQEPFSFDRMVPEEVSSYTTHAVPPASLLKLYHDHFTNEAPTSYLLAIRGEQFNLGEPISQGGRDNLDRAMIFLLEWLLENGEINAS